MWLAHCLSVHHGRTDIMAISEHLDLAARVAAAEPLIGLWDLHHPTRPQLASLDDIAEAFRAGTPRENDLLLLRLAELAHVDGGGSVDAAAVLAKLVLPGVAARLRRCAAGGFRGEVDQHAAALLWILCRTFPYKTSHWVATVISWRVFRGTQHELGRGGQGRTWDATVVAGDPSWWADETGEEEAEQDAAGDLGLAAVGSGSRGADCGGHEGVDDVGAGEPSVAVVEGYPAWAAVGPGVAGCRGRARCR
jgi:hypothetical protein